MFFMDVADVFLGRVGKIQEEFIVNNVFFFSLLTTNVFSEYLKAVNATLSSGS